MKQKRLEGDQAWLDLKMPVDPTMPGLHPRSVVLPCPPDRKVTSGQKADFVRRCCLPKNHSPCNSFQRSPQRHTSLESHQTSHRISGLRFSIMTFLIIFFRLRSANTFLFKNNFHFLRVNNFLLFLIHTSVARGALQAMTFGAAILAGVALPSPPDRKVTSGGACFRIMPRSASMARGASRKATRPLVAAKSQTIPSRAGHKTTPPGRESPTENQTLGHAVLQMSWVVCFQMLSVFKCICYVRYYYACYLKFRFFCFICLTHTRNTYNSSESQYTHIQQIHSASRNDVSMTTWTTCTPNHLAVSQS